MLETSFKNYLEEHINLPKDAYDLVEDYSVKEVKKGDYLLRQGEFCKYTFFVEKGLLTQYYLDEKGKEHVLMFAPENWFVSDRQSIFFNQSSAYNIQAREDSRVALLDNAYMQRLMQIEGFTEFNNKLLHNHVLHLQKRIKLLLSNTAEERYLQFIEMYPDLLLRVPQNMIASYLGITPESLSRVRKELAHKNFRS